MNSYATNIFYGNIAFKLMQIKNKFPDAKIIWGGDFNCVHNDLLDRWPPKEDGMCEIKNVCLRLGLIVFGVTKIQTNFHILGVTKISLSSHVSIIF